MARKYLLLQRRWWVPYYCRATVVFLWTITPFVDSERIEIFIENNIKFLVNYGYKVTSTDVDPEGGVNEK